MMMMKKNVEQAREVDVRTTKRGGREVALPCLPAQSPPPLLHETPTRLYQAPSNVEPQNNGLVPWKLR